MTDSDTTKGAQDENQARISNPVQEGRLDIALDNYCGFDLIFAGRGS
jgi:hypothetical protein